MKNRFNTVDVIVAVKELQKSLIGMRVSNVYNVDNKTYLLKLARDDNKAMLLFESGIRIHITDFEWPKHMMPSGFAMKMRKHIRNKRLERVSQLGIDRIIDMQFGMNEAAYHVMLELYDRGNIVFTDFEFNILNILRRRIDGNEDVKFLVGEKYPVSSAKQLIPHELDSCKLDEIIAASKAGSNLRKILNPHFAYGTAVLEHCLSSVELSGNLTLGKDFHNVQDIPRLPEIIELSHHLINDLSTSDTKGYIMTKEDKKTSINIDGTDTISVYIEFHPIIYNQNICHNNIEFDSFNKAVDEFFSKIESQKIDMKALQQEKSALKKLENIKKDHEKRIEDLEKIQISDSRKAELIELNHDLVDKACLVVNSALASQMEWGEIREYVDDFQSEGNPVALAIVDLMFDRNHITLILKEPNEDENNDKGSRVDIDLSLTAYANASKYFSSRKHAATKQNKTMESSSKALKSAERKTKQELKDVAVKTRISKIRKTYWFEKFYWFISSENYMVVGGRDQQQNELLVKRYMSPSDVYVHADLHGGSSVLVKMGAPSGSAGTGTATDSLPQPPPKTLHEAGMAAVCYSAAWDAKVTTQAWWVRQHQVSKTAPTGEYLTTGAFMIRGKKNYLPTTTLMMGFTFVFKLDDDSIVNHKGERCVKQEMLDAGGEEQFEGTEEEVEMPLDEEDEGDKESSGDVESEDKDVAGDSAESSSEEPGDGGADTPTGNDGSVDTLAAAAHDGKPAGMEYPDTTIQLKYIKGGQFDVHRQRSVSTASTGSGSTGHPRTSSHLSSAAGDGEGDGAPENAQHISKPKISAKQRREMKKERKKGVTIDTNHIGETNEVDGKECSEGEAESVSIADDVKQDVNKKKEAAMVAEQPQKLKRGQKGKLKKMKQKYKDQDEEEREMRMKLLGAMGPQRERKHDKKKGRKCGVEPEKRREERHHNAQAAPSAGGERTVTVAETGDSRVTVAETGDSRVTVAETGDSRVTVAETGDSTAPVAAETATISERRVDPDGGDGDEEVDEVGVAGDAAVAVRGMRDDDTAVIDSLTGVPTDGDLLLFAVPCVAPYAAIHSYKYKVKLTPGTGRRGKAVKTALNMFLREKTSSPMEKDLLKAVKDLDLARNIPGKVKLSAPNLQRHRSKK